MTINSGGKFTFSFKPLALSYDEITCRHDEQRNKLKGPTKFLENENTVSL